jgi:hypothetical protein
MKNYYVPNPNSCPPSSLARRGLERGKNYNRNNRKEIKI